MMYLTISEDHLCDNRNSLRFQIFSPSESPDPEEISEEEPEQPEPETYRIISVEDSPELFPFLIEQFYRLKEQFPSICCGSVYLDIHVFSSELNSKPEIGTNIKTFYYPY